MTADLATRHRRTPTFNRIGTIKMKKRILFLGPCIALGIGMYAGWFMHIDEMDATALEQAPPPYVLDRTILPIAEPKLAPITELDARDTKPPPRFEVKAPAGAPNVLIVLIDDMGFGQSSIFGGPIHMPTVERLASGGLRYNQFH